MKTPITNYSKVLFSIPFALFVLVLCALSLLAISIIATKGLLSENLFNNTKGFFFLFLIPFVFMCFGGLYLYLVIANSLQNHKQSRASLQFFFITVVLSLSALLPVVLILGNFARYSLRSWLDVSMSESLTSALAITQDYIEVRKTPLENISSQYFNGLAITNYIQRPSDWIHDIRLIDPLASSCQVYRLEENTSIPLLVPIVETGDSNTFLDTKELVSMGMSFFLTDKDANVLRSGKTVRYAGKEYFCVISSALPENFQKNIKSIEKAKERASIIEILRPHVPFLGMWMCLLFCFPLLLVFFAFTWLISIQFTNPLVACIDAANRLYNKEEPISVITHKNSTISSIAQVLNNCSETLET